MINDRYKIIRKLGTGRSQVYLCLDKYNPLKEIAIKILSSANNKELESFRNEYFLLKKINHPNIVQVFEYGTILSLDNEDTNDSEIIEGSKYFTQEYVEGENLQQYEPANNLTTLYQIVEQICTVLFFLHQSNYIYYDLKPENILIKNKKNGPHIYLYDFGLTKFIPKNDPFEVQGTPNYIAPEILKINRVDHRADLYSLGIMLYYLIYNKFPFATDNELNIYKANIDEEFEFPPRENYEDLIRVAKKLLCKSPSDRYQTSLHVLEELKLPIAEQAKNNWIPIKVFCGRKKESYDINSVIFNKKSKDVISIRGVEGSGKSTFLEEINYNHINSILIKSSDINYNNPLWFLLLRNIFYTDTVFKNLTDSLKNEIRDLLYRNQDELVEKLKSVFLRISRENKFLLLLDDFDNYDELSIEILKDLIPILQVNGIKIVIAEDSTKNVLSDFINNLKVFYLSPFVDDDLNEFIEKSYFHLFPKKQLRNFIAHHSDLFPGNIILLLKNILLFNILHYDYKNIALCKNENSYKNIKDNLIECYKYKLQYLSKDEINIINLISLFNINLDVTSISILSGLNKLDVTNILCKLKEIGIIHTTNQCTNPQFVSTGLKNIVYENISSIKELHLSTAENILKLIPEFNRIECARQFKLGGKYKQSYDLIINELKTDTLKSALLYQKKLLKKILDFPLEEKDLLEAKYLLSEVLFKIGEYSNCLTITDELLEKELTDDQTIEMILQKGKCLVKLNRYNEGIELLKSILQKSKTENDKQKIYVEIADAELDLGNYSYVNEICRNIVNNKQCKDEIKAKAYSLIALIDIKKDNNLAAAIYNLNNSMNMYEKANLPYFVALMEMNIGNIISLKGNQSEALKHWEESYKINEKIGNLSHEANLLLNYGVYYYNTQVFEKAILQYQRAESIFSSLGNNFGRGLALSNLGEVYINICEYDLALQNLENAKDIFNKIGNIEEELEEMFLLGQCYFYLGDTENLNHVINSYGNLLNRTNNTDKHKYNLDYLKILLFYCNDNYSEIKNSNIEFIMEYYKSQEDNDNLYYFAKLNAFLTRSLINIKELETAINLLNNPDYLKRCDKNIVLRAEREYLFGIIAEDYNKSVLEPAVEYYNKALKLIENQSILELTWEINFALAKFYFERGNYKRFYEYSIITKSLINFISSKISSKRTKGKYLNSFKRKDAIETLEKYEKLI